MISSILEKIFESPAKKLFPKENSLDTCRPAGNKQETNFSCKALVIIITGRPSQIQKEDAHLPPELRRAGLLAHMHVPKGKCFGPFNGKIMDRKKSPDKMHFLVSQVSVYNSGI